ncbi:MAG: thiamine pyrophosphate-dependent enzyme [Thermodesulfobacteriota bacterium]
MTDFLTAATIPGEILLQGNQAIARGALEAGLAFISGYPGNPSSEIIETLAEVGRPDFLHVEWSVNEKVALEAAAAASLAGLRAMVTMKQNGVNVCLDALTTLALAGFKAGIVLLAADDPAGISSSNEQDSRFAAALAHVPLLEPATPQEALEMVRFAFDLSEDIGQLVMVRGVGRVSHTRANVRPGELPKKKRQPYFDTSASFHTFPVVGKHRAMYAKLAKARAAFEKSSFNSYQGPAASSLTIVASGPGALYAQEALEMTGLRARVGLLKLGATHPLPRDFLLNRLARTSEVLIVEEIDPVLERAVLALAAEAGGEIGTKNFYGKSSGHIPAVGELSPGLVARALAMIIGRRPKAATAYQARAAEICGRLAPPREFGFCPGCPHRASFWAIKNVLTADDRRGFVSGDIGCYTMGVWPTGFGQIKTLGAMGSGLGMSSGFGKLKGMGFDQPVISVVGDSTFFHAGLPALINAAYNQSAYLLVVLDNSATAMTGFQPHPGTGQSPSGETIGSVEIERLCASLNIKVTVTDPYDLAATEKVLAEGLQDLTRVRVVVLRRECALVRGRAGGFPYRMSIDGRLCRGRSCGCNRYCNRVFRCPGLIWDEKAGQARIDEVICVGCGVCRQVCPAGAIIQEKVQ